MTFSCNVKLEPGKVYREGFSLQLRLEDTPVEQPFLCVREISYEEHQQALLLEGLEVKPTEDYKYFYEIHTD